MAVSYCFNVMNENGNASRDATAEPVEVESLAEVPTIGDAVYFSDEHYSGLFVVVNRVFWILERNGETSVQLNVRELSNEEHRKYSAK